MFHAYAGISKYFQNIQVKSLISSKECAYFKYFLLSKIFKFTVLENICAIYSYKTKIHLPSFFWEFFLINIKILQEIDIDVKRGTTNMIIRTSKISFLLQSYELLILSHEKKCRLWLLPTQRIYRTYISNIRPHRDITYDLEQK